MHTLTNSLFPPLFMYLDICKKSLFGNVAFLKYITEQNVDILSLRWFRCHIMYLDMRQIYWFCLDMSSWACSFTQALTPLIRPFQTTFFLNPGLICVQDLGLWTNWLIKPASLHPDKLYITDLCKHQNVTKYCHCPGFTNTLRTLNTVCAY